MVKIFGRTLRDPEKLVRDSLVHHSVSGEFAFRSGKWKMIPSKKMLFNLATDPAEEKNQWNDQLKIVSKLKQLMEKITVAR